MKDFWHPDRTGALAGSICRFRLASRFQDSTSVGRVIIGVTPFRVLITLHITYLVSPLGL